MGPPGYTVHHHHWVYVDNAHVCSPNVHTYRVSADRVTHVHAAARPAMGSQGGHGQPYVRPGPPITELRTAVNLMRAQAGLTPFAFDAGFDSSAIVRASHVTGLQTALTQARQQLGMSTPSLKAVSAGKLIRTSEIQQMRDLAR